ncbi:MAG: FG-GAP repeat protein [Pirellulales bacterium]
MLKPLVVLVAIFAIQTASFSSHFEIPPATEFQLLTANDAQLGGFGESVAIDGRTAIIAAPYVNGGSAYIFRVQPNGSWTQLAKIHPNDIAQGDFFGSSVSISGQTTLIGSRLDDVNGTNDTGSAYVFRENESGEWLEIAKLIANDGATGDGFGRSVAVGHRIALVGAPFADSLGLSSGSVYVFEENSFGHWEQTTKLTPNDLSTRDNLGYSVALSGQTALVGARGDNLRGAAYVFRQNGSGNWAQIAKLTADDSETFDEFGTSVALDGDLALVGATSSNLGAAYLFEENELGDWEQIAKIENPPGGGAFFGYSVALYEGLALVGTYNMLPSNFEKGSAHFFEADETGNWVHIGAFESRALPGEQHVGASVALARNTALIGYSVYVHHTVPEPASLWLAIAFTCFSGWKSSPGLFRSR